MPSGPVTTSLLVPVPVGSPLRELIAEGVQVAIVARDPDRIKATAAEIGAIGIAVDGGFLNSI